MEIADWYAYIRRKYCPACAAAVKRRQNAARMADLRKITRQQNAAVRELCTVQAAELAALRAASGQEADCLFLELMTRHHEGAIPMAEAVIELGSEPRTLTVAAGMKKAQTFEIEAMTAIAERLGCSG